MSDHNRQNRGKPDVDNLEGWPEAAELVANFGRLPSPIVGLVRVLVADSEYDPFTATHGTKFTLIRLLNSDVFKAPYFFSVAMFKPESLTARNRPFSTSDFLEVFSAGEHAFFTSSIFLYKHARRICAAEPFEEVTRYIQSGLNLGWSIGSALDSIGTLFGMLVGGYRWYGTLPFLAKDPDEFGHYLRHLKRYNKPLPDADYERATWGCSSSQTGILLLQQMGFKSPQLQPIFAGTQTSALVAAESLPNFACRATDVWLRYFLKDETHSEVPLPAEFYLAEPDRKWISTCVAEAEPSKNFNWLSAVRDDISPKLTPQLFIPDPTDEFSGIEGFASGENDSIILDETTS